MYRDEGRDQEDSDKKAKEFVLGRRGQLVFFTLAVLTLMAALDGTSLSVALPVSLYPMILISSSGRY